MKARYLLILLLFGLSAAFKVGAGGTTSNVPMTRPGEVLAVNYTNFFHSSTFVELEGGRILQAADTSFATSDDGGVTWSPTFQCRDLSGNFGGGGGTCLVRLSGRGVGLAAYVSNPKIPSWADGNRRRGMYCVFWRSEDGGKTWQPPVKITEPGSATASLQDVLLRT